MANHEVPRTATRVERFFGIDAEGDVIVTSVYQHTRAGHAHPMFYVVQYRERLRRIDRSTRWTREFSGPAARERMESQANLGEARALCAESRERASRRVRA
jgi:hypothetical protein